MRFFLRKATFHRAGRALLLASALGLAWASNALAASGFPDRPIKLVVPWPAGGMTDSVSRVLAEALGDELGTTVMVENKAGATGVVGAQAAARAPGDGYTLFMASAETHAINPNVYRTLPYDAIADFVPVRSYIRVPFAMIGRGDLDAKTLADVIELARSNPGKLTYATFGVGSTSQIGMEMFKQNAGLDILHVPFQGEAPAVTALLGGQVDLMILPAGRAVDLSSTGKLKVFGVTTAQRTKLAPDLPTFAEQGVTGLDVGNWFGVLAPAGTPQDRVKALADATSRAVARPAVLESLKAQRVEPLSMPAEDFQQFLVTEKERWGETIEKAGIVLE